MADVVLNPKAPGDTVRYVVPFAIAPDTISEAPVYTVTAGTITVAADSDHDDANAYPLVAGGANGESASFTVRIATALGQILTKTVDLKITTGADVLGPDSAITKGTLVIRALGKLGIANYVFDTEAEEDASALRQLDSLAADWQGKTSGLAYSQPATNGASLPSDSSGIDEADVDAFVYNLAEMLAGDYGKTPALNVMKRAATTRSDILIKYQAKREYDLPSRSITGAGNDRCRRPRYF